MATSFGVVFSPFKTLFSLPLQNMEEDYRSKGGKTNSKKLVKSAFTPKSIATTASAELLSDSVPPLPICHFDKDLQRISGNPALKSAVSSTRPLAEAQHNPKTQ